MLSGRYEMRVTLRSLSADKIPRIKMIIFAVVIALGLVWGPTASARNNFIDASVLADCDEAALPFAVHIVQADMPLSLMQDIVAANDTSITTNSLTFPKGQTIAVVVDAYTKGQLMTLPVVVRAPDGEEVWRTELKLRQTSGSGDAFRITRAAEVKAADWGAFKSGGIYTVETLLPEGTNCSTTVSSWFLVPDGNAFSP